MKAPKFLILVAIPLCIGLWIDNFMPGYYLDQRAWPYKLYISFFNDLALPFGFYFLLCLLEKWFPALQRWQVKCFLAWSLPASFEIGQFIYQKSGLTQILMMYGGAFDPLDLVAYAAGGLLAALLERRVLARVFKFWEPDGSPSNFKLKEI